MDEVLVNTRVRIDGRGYEPDFAWPALRLMVEVDTYRTHGSARAYRHDRRRDRAFRMAGWHVARFDEEEILASPDLVGGELVALAAACGRRSGRDERTTSPTPRGGGADPAPRR